MDETRQGATCMAEAMKKDRKHHNTLLYMKVLTIEETYLLNNYVHAL